MNKSLLTFLLVVIAILGLMMWGKSNQKAALQSSAAGSAGSFVADETFYDFGTIRMKDGRVSKSFAITNTSDKGAVLSRVTTSCMCTTAYLESEGREKGPFGMPGHGGAVPPANETFRPGESRRVRVVFDPNAHGPAGVGLIDRSVYLVDDAGGSVTLRIKATVKP